MTCIAAGGTGSVCKQPGGIKRLYIASRPDLLAITPTRVAGGAITDIDDDATALVFYEFELTSATAFFKENTVGDISLGFEKAAGGFIEGYSDAMNVILDPVWRGRSIAIAEGNNGKWFIQGDENPLRAVASENGIVEGVDGNNGYNLSLMAKDGVPMREIDFEKIVFAAGQITVTSA